MKAIRTRYLGPTNHRGTRIKADDGDGNNITLGRDYALDVRKDHERAAEALRFKMQWNGTLRGGYYKGDYFWVFVG